MELYFYEGMASYDKPEVVERDVKDKEHEKDNKPKVVERYVKDKGHKEGDTPELLKGMLRTRSTRRMIKRKGKVVFLNR